MTQGQGASADLLWPISARKFPCLSITLFPSLTKAPATIPLSTGQVCLGPQIPGKKSGGRSEDMMHSAQLPPLLLHFRVGTESCLQTSSVQEAINKHGLEREKVSQSWSRPPSTILIWKRRTTHKHTHKSQRAGIAQGW